MVARVGVGEDTAARIWFDHGLKPWKLDTFKPATILCSSSGKRARPAWHLPLIENFGSGPPSVSPEAGRSHPGPNASCRYPRGGRPGSAAWGGDRQHLGKGRVCHRGIRQDRDLGMGKGGEAVAVIQMVAGDDRGGCTCHERHHLSAGVREAEADVAGSPLRER